LTSILKWLTTVRFATLTFALIFVALLAADTVDSYAVYSILLRFREALATVVALSVSLIVFPFVSVPAVESIVERAERLGIRVNPRLVKDYVDGCFTMFLLATTEIILAITIQLTEDTHLITLAAFALLLTLTIEFFTVVSSLWKATRLLQEAVEKS